MIQSTYAIEALRISLLDGAFAAASGPATGSVAFPAPGAERSAARVSARLAPRGRIARNLLPRSILFDCGKVLLHNEWSLQVARAGE